MKLIGTPLGGVFIIEPDVYKDERGYFLETYRKSFFAELLKGSYGFLQDNESLSSKGVLRGIHYQLPPFAQAKLVRVVCGAVFDVAVDLRKSSPNFGKWFGLELSSENKRQLFIPRGFGHGFVALKDGTVVAYKVDNYYNKDSDRGVRFDDKDINIDWPFDVNELIISEKDKSLPLLSNADVFE